ncbi:MAG: ATP-grasp domain-containing protein [Jatrophihabitantaceae bacterium]
MTSRSAYDPAGPAVIVDPYSSGAQLAPAFAARDIDTVAVLSAPQPPSVYAGSYRPQDFSQVMIDDGDLGSLVARVRSLHPRCVLAGCESGVELAERLAPLVVPEVANVAALAGARRHKGQMADAVARSGRRTIAQVCASSADEVARWISSAGLSGHDLVIKPPKSASTDGVTLIPRGQGWEKIFGEALDSVNRLGIINDSMIVQQYIEGTEYVVDTFSHDGVHTVTDVCRYTKVRNGPHMAVYDTMEWVDPNLKLVDELISYTRGVLDAVGLRFGAAHVEIMSTAEGPVLIELGARPHGGGQPRFCLLATRDSQIERTVRYFDGQSDIPSGYQLVQQVLIVFHIVGQAARVADVDGPARIRALPNYYDSSHNFEPGDRIEATKDLFGSLDVGFVVLSGSERAALWKDYHAIRSIETEMFPACEPAASGSRSALAAG